jgi:hypothetical protein
MAQRTTRLPVSPKLPAATPAPLSAFVQGRADRVELAPGAQPWLPIAGGFVVPRATFRSIEPLAGSGLAGSGRVEVRLRAMASLVVELGVERGRLVAEPTSIPSLAGRPAEVRRLVAQWVDDLNAWFTSQGRRIARLAVEAGNLVCTARPAPASRRAAA